MNVLKKVVEHLASQHARIVQLKAQEEEAVNAQKEVEEGDEADERAHVAEVARLQAALAERKERAQAETLRLQAVVVEATKTMQVIVEEDEILRLYLGGGSDGGSDGGSEEEEEEDDEGGDDEHPGHPCVRFTRYHHTGGYVQVRLRPGSLEACVRGDKCAGGSQKKPVEQFTDDCYGGYVQPCRHCTEKEMPTDTPGSALSASHDVRPPAPAPAPAQILPRAPRGRTEKTCDDCHIEKPLDLEHWGSNGFSAPNKQGVVLQKYSPVCRACMKARKDAGKK